MDERSTHLRASDKIQIRGFIADITVRWFGTTSLSREQVRESSVASITNSVRFSKNYPERLVTLVGSRLKRSKYSVCQNCTDIAHALSNQHRFITGQVDNGGQSARDHTTV